MKTKKKPVKAKTAKKKQSNSIKIVIDYKPILSLEELVKLLDCGKTNIYSLLKDKTIKRYFFKNNRRPYFKTAEILEALELE